MKKKLFIILMCILGCAAISYNHIKNNSGTALFAQSSPTFQLQKGAKVILGKYNNREIVWDIAKNTNTLLLMSSKPIANVQSYDSSLPFTTNSSPSLADRDSYCIKYLQPNGEYYYSYCPEAPLQTEINRINLNTLENSIIDRIPFLPSISEVKNGGSLGLTLADRAYHNDVVYWLLGRITSDTYLSGVYAIMCFNTAQYPLNLSAGDDFFEFDTGIRIMRDEKIQWHRSVNWSIGSNVQIVTAPLRPYATVNYQNIVFAANTSYTDGAWHNYVIDTSNFNENNELNPNKLRIQSSLTTSLQDIKNESRTKSISKVIKNGSVNLYVNANTGTNTKISVILYNEAGTEILHYRMLENTRGGTKHYIVDLINIAVGN